MSTAPKEDEVSANATKSQNGESREKKLSPRPRRLSLIQYISESDKIENMSNETYTELLQRLMAGPDPMPVVETANTETGWPHGFLDRASWALELEMSMRGVGFTWTTADVRHTRKTWLPTVGNRIHSLVAHVGPVLLVCWAIIRYLFVNYLALEDKRDPKTLGCSPFDERLPFRLQLLLTAALGAFLMAAFSVGHSIFAIVLSPLAPSPLAFFPSLYTTRIWDVTSVRGFWSYGWHRLFARLFLVYGVWPGEWLERKIIGKTPGQSADIGKVLGGFGSSAFVHSFAVRGVLGGDWWQASGEGKFFVLNGIAISIEEVVKKTVVARRKLNGWPAIAWYDAWIGRVWWMVVLLLSGRNFARGWTKAGLVREMAFL